ncbi:MAG: hypothetical protein L6305_07415 [Actinomycetia bacterium]|nr:hypothetical protein [Actinomycetes bacterium]
MITSKEVINNLLMKKRKSRIGLSDGIWSDTLQKWVKQGYPVTKKIVEMDNQKIEKEVEEPVDVHEHFGFDMISVGGWFDALPIKGFNEIIEETDEWRITLNGAGAALKFWKHKSGTPEHIDFKMTSREIWERDYRTYLLNPDPSRIDIAGTKTTLENNRKKGFWTSYGHLFIWENMRQSMGDVCMYESLCLDPEWIHDYNRVYTDFFKAHYKILFQEVGIPDGIWVYEDLGYKNGLFCSPKQLEELIFPYYKELVDFFHSYNLPVILHSCGNITEALPLIVQTGFDGLNPMEVKAGCDIFKFAEQYGDKLVFVGGLDARILESGDKSLIKKSVIALIEGMKKRGARFVFGSDHSISTNVKYEDFKYAIGIYHEHMMY